MTVTLVDFLLARLDERETRVDTVYDLADIAAKRRIIGEGSRNN